MEKYPFESHNDEYGSTRTYQNLQLAEKMNKIRTHYEASKKDALRRLKDRIGWPNFPQSLWEPVLLNQYVDFRKIHAVWSGGAPDEATVHAMQHFKFVVNQIESKGPMVSESAWTAAFNSYSKAVVYVYLHRSRELVNYQGRMQEVFRYHGDRSIKSIIKIDETFRTMLAGDNRLTFDDFESASPLLYSMLGQGESVRGGPSGRRFDQGDRDICRRYNVGKAHQNCGFRHICLKCKGSHRQSECTRGKDGKVSDA